MSVLDSVLSAVRLRRQEKFRTTWRQYWGLVGNLCDEQQIDADLLGEFLDTLDKSDADLQADIETLRKRRALVAMRDEYYSESKRVPKLEAELEKARRELRAAVDALQPKVDAATQAWKESLCEST